jgi:prefoldin subunit 5
MLEDAKKLFDIKRRECKDLRKEIKAFKQAFDELNASHERLEEAMRSLARLTRSLKKLIPLCLMSKIRRNIL